MCRVSQSQLTRIGRKKANFSLKKGCGTPRLYIPYFGLDETIDLNIKLVNGLLDAHKRTKLVQS